MRVHRFCFLLILTILYTFQVEGMVFEQPTTKVLRLVVNKNILNSSFKSFGVIAQDFFSERTLTAKGKKDVFSSIKREFSNQAKGGELSEEDLKRHLLEGYNKIKSGYQFMKERKIEESVCVLGETGSGKSTLGLFLKGFNPKFYKDDRDGIEKIRFFEKEAENLIGNTLKAHTLYPTLNVAGNIALWDCPGLKDNRGEDYRFLINIFVDYLIKEGGDKRFLIALEDNSLIVGRANCFHSIINEIQKLLTNSKGPVFNVTGKGGGASIDSIVWVITKSTRTAEQIKNTLDEISGIRSELLNNFLKKIAPADRDIEEEINSEELIRSCKNNHVKLDLKNANSRKEVFDLIQRTKAVQANSTFVNADQEDRLVKLIKGLLVKVKQLDNEVERIKDDISEHKKQKIKIELEYLPNTEEQFLSTISSEINNNEKEKKKLEEQKEIKKKYIDNKYLPKEFLIKEINEKEKRTVLLPGFLNFSRSYFHLSYNAEKPLISRIEGKRDIHSELTEFRVDDAPFLSFQSKRYEEEIIDSAKFTKPLTYFAANYKGGVGKDCSVNIKLYSEQHHSKQEQKDDLEELRKIDKKIEEFNNYIGFLVHIYNMAQTQGINEAKEELKSTRLKSNQENRLVELAKKHDAIERSLIQFESKKDKKEKDLNSEINLGYALLAMGPQYLEEHPDVKDFKDQFKTMAL